MKGVFVGTLVLLTIGVVITQPDGSKKELANGTDKVQTPAAKSIDKKEEVGTSTYTPLKFKLTTGWEIVNFENDTVTTGKEVLKVVGEDKILGNRTLTVKNGAMHLGTQILKPVDGRIILQDGIVIEANGTIVIDGLLYNSDEMEGVGNSTEVQVKDGGSTRDLTCQGREGGYCSPELDNCCAGLRCVLGSVCVRNLECLWEGLPCIHTTSIYTQYPKCCSSQCVGGRCVKHSCNIPDLDGTTNGIAGTGCNSHHASECCSGICNDRKCCGRIGDRCTPGHHSDCCSGFCKDQGVQFSRCHCGKVGERCLDDSECCHGGECKGARCTNCFGRGAYCKVGSGTCCKSSNLVCRLKRFAGTGISAVLDAIAAQLDATNAALGSRNGTCGDCGKVGERCLDDSECCRGGECKGARCTNVREINLN